MRKLLSLILLSLLSINANADYGYLSLSELVCDADYAAVGSIVKLDKNYFYLKVSELILGDFNGDTLKIQRFKDWGCGRRFSQYETGQKELVFFRKSNYVIDDYELLGYGGGCEFELPIRNDIIMYNASFSNLDTYRLKDFLTALKDYGILKQRTKSTSATVSREEQKVFADRSPLHKLFIECRSGKYEPQFEIPTEGYIVNLEANYLYQDYENKIFIANVNMDSVTLFVEDAEVWKKGQYFVVKPKDGWTRRWLNVYAKNDSLKTRVLFNQIFEIVELPEPRIYFRDYYGDTIYSGRAAIPRVKHYLDDLHYDEHLNYELLSYTYEIKSEGHVESFKIKSARGTNELYERIGKLQPNDQVTIKDVYVLYPDKTVKQIKGRTVYVGRSE